MNKRITLASDTINKEDINALVKWLSSDPIPQLTKSKLTIQYEKEYARRVGRKYGVFVNSGSSANLLCIYSLIATQRLKNDKVVVPSLAWITTISPIIQFGLTPIPCDINMQDLSVDYEHLERIFKEQNPSCLFLVSILGLCPDMGRIESLCKKYDVILVFDNCESQGSEYNGISLESLGVMSTCSSYYGHVSSTIEGGMIVTDDNELYYTLNMLRSHGWARDIDKEVETALRLKWGVSDFISRYTFYQTGFNVRNTEIGAFLGLRQLNKLDDFIEKRNNNYLLFNQLLKNDFWKAPTHKDSFVSNLGYPIIHPRREKIVSELESANVEIRPLVSGAMGSQPFFIEKYGRVHLPHVSIVNDYGFYIPNHQGLTKEDIHYMCDIINKFTL